MSLLAEVWDAVKAVAGGLATVNKRIKAPPATEFYPYQKPKVPPVSVQFLALIQNEDGTDRCVACLACERVCPSQVIAIERKRNPEGKGFVLERFDLDFANCMHCANCVEACPVSAIVTVPDFEHATYDIRLLKADKAMLDHIGQQAPYWYSPKFGVELRTPEGKIEKAPPEMQPGGLAELLKEEEA